MGTRFIYSTLRFVPDPARGEFVNIGFIVGSDDTKEWQLRLVDNMRRARYMDDARVLPQALVILNDIGRKLDRFTESINWLIPVEYTINEEWLASYFEQSQNVIQLSQPTPIVASDIDGAMQIIFDELIIDPAIRSRPVTTKHTALATVRKAYKRAGLFRQDVEGNVIEHAQIASPKYTGHFDFVVANGSAVQLAQTWSFEIMDEALVENVKAWAWTVQDIREHGGTVRHGKGRLPIHSNVEIDVVYVPPSNTQRNAFAEARYAFVQVGVNLYELDGADSVAARARKLLMPNGET